MKTLDALRVSMAFLRPRSRDERIRDQSPDHLPSLWPRPLPTATWLSRHTSKYKLVGNTHTLNSYPQNQKNKTDICSTKNEMHAGGKNKKKKTKTQVQTKKDVVAVPGARSIRETMVALCSGSRCPDQKLPITLKARWSYYLPCGQQRMSTAQSRTKGFQQGNAILALSPPARGKKDGCSPHPLETSDGWHWVTASSRPNDPNHSAETWVVSKIN